MAHDSTVQLIKDFTDRLTAVVTEFGARADRILVDPDAAGDAIDRESWRDRAERFLTERRLRKSFFPAELFHEPAWEMLVCLFLAHLDRKTWNLKDLIACADAPASTGQRWIDQLVRQGLVERVTDPDDRRRIDLALSDSGVRAMAGYIERSADRRANHPDRSPN